MHRVALGDVIFCFLPKIFPGRLKRFRFFGFQRSNHVETRLVLEFVKVHLSIPSGRRRFFSAPIRAASSPCLTVYSFLPRFRADSFPEKMRDLWPAVARPARCR